MKTKLLMLLLIGIMLLSGCVNQQPMTTTTSSTSTSTSMGTTTSTRKTTTTTISNETAKGEYNPIINPANFVAKIDNQYYSLVPGTTFIYQGEADGETEKNEVYVTHQTKNVLGVITTVIRDRVFDADNELTEETFDWYAQDRNGDVWYFGEDSKEYEGGVVVSTEGSWEASVDGAKPGIIMKANPKVGDSWKQEYYKDVAEDQAEVLGLNESISVPYGSFKDCIKTRDWTPLQPDIEENKYYCPNTGVVLTVMVKGGSEQMELIDITTE
jgi:hypothetical protein